MASAKRIVIHEVGPREGMQIEKTPIPTAQKIRFVDMLSDCVFPKIQVTSFVSPKWVPQMADAKEVAAGISRRPESRINLHLHDTRGLGIANALAAMEMGVDGFDSSVAALGGCPYAGFKDAPGNIATEDLVHLCNEIGVETGVDLERLLEAAREAEKIVGHPLPGKVMRSGTLESYRRKARNQAPAT